jgi:hypothetical protein
VAGCFENGGKYSGSTKCGGFRDWLIKTEFLTKDSIPSSQCGRKWGYSGFGLRLLKSISKSGKVTKAQTRKKYML